MMMYGADAKQFSLRLFFPVFQPLTLIFMETHQTPAWNETENRRAMEKKSFVDGTKKQKKLSMEAFWHALSVSECVGANC